MNEEKEKDTKKKNELTKVELLQLIMIVVLVVGFIIILAIQPILNIYEELRGRIIVAEIVIGIGILIEIGYFIWHKYQEEIRAKIRGKK